MKLRNLLFGTMIALAFTACSDDNDPIVTPEPEVKGNVLDIKLDGLTTKAEVDDAEVKTLTVVVFDAEDKVEAVETKDVTTVTEITGVEIATAGEKSVIVLANVPANTIADGLSLEDFMKLTYTHEDETGSYTMSSKLYTNVQIASGNNYMGYLLSAGKNGNLIESNKPVILYRNVASVNLTKVSMSETFIEKYGDQYPHASIEIKEVMILQGHNSTMLANAAEWGKIENANNSYLNYWGSTDFLAAVGQSKFDKFYAPSSSATLNASAYTTYFYEVENGYIYNNRVVDKGNGETTTTSNSLSINHPFYVYENLSKPGDEEPVYTLLVLKGDLKYGQLVTDEDGPVMIDNPAFDEDKEISETNPAKIQQVEEITVADRYYTIAVGVTGFAQGYSMPDAVSTTSGQSVNYASLITNSGRTGANNKYYGVMRNLQYNISIGLNNPGYKTPWGDGDFADATFDVFCEVAPWGVVTQNAIVD